jgi:pre-mRNA-processing factor 17
MKMKLMLLKPNDKEVALNIRYEELSRPIQGPVNPFNGVSNERKNVLTGKKQLLRTQH